MSAPSTTEIGWRQFSIRVIEGLRWPIAFVVMVLILREPFGRLIDAVTKSLG